MGSIITDNQEIINDIMVLNSLSVRIDYSKIGITFKKGRNNTNGAAGR